MIFYYRCQHTSLTMVTFNNKHVGRIAYSQAQQISPVMDMENERLSKQALVLLPLCRIVDCTGTHTYLLEIVGKDNRQLLSQKSRSVVASTSNTDNGVSPVMEEASTELRCQKLLNKIITVTTTASKEWTNQDMSQMETFVGAEALTLMKKGN